MLVGPFSRCPVKRWDQDESSLTVIVKSYQPLAANVAVLLLVAGGPKPATAALAWYGSASAGGSASPATEAVFPHEEREMLGKRSSARE